MQKHNCQYTVGPSQRCEVCGIRKELTDPQAILTRETRKNCLALAEKYGLTEIPENVEMRLKVAQAEKDLARSTQLARKAINSMEIACLVVGREEKLTVQIVHARWKLKLVRPMAWLECLRRRVNAKQQRSSVTGPKNLENVRLPWLKRL